MSERVAQLLAQMHALESELMDALHAQEHTLHFQIRGKRVVFERTVAHAHRAMRTGLLRWLVAFRPQNLLTGPVIYAMIVPLLLADLCVSLYQWSCFPIYGIARVRRGDYLVFDRHHLGYLNLVEKFHCTYCEYGNGLMAYLSEILSRTEEYFCPIKHARQVLGTHARYRRFLAYGDAQDYEARLEAFRVGLGEHGGP